MMATLLTALDMRNHGMLGMKSQLLFAFAFFIRSCYKEHGLQMVSGLALLFNE